MSEKDNIEYKFILIGNSAVGKTTLFKKVTTGEFSEKNISTIGVDKKSFQIDVDVTEKGKTSTKNFKISLFDTAGQEKFRSITKAYYKGADCILLIYNITNRVSYDNVSLWIESIHTSLGDHNSEEYLIILIGNKKDLIGVDGLKRCVEEEEAEKQCKDKGLVWGGECSIKDFSCSDLKELIKGFTKQIYEKIGQKKVGEQKVKSINLKKKVENRNKPGLCNCRNVE